MSKKTERLDVIRNLIDSEQISSQEELLSWLKRVGIDATQSTLSRDMKEVRAIKVPDAEKGYVYLLPETLQGEQTSGKVSSSVTDNIRYIEFSGNMIVIRTKAGYAKAVGVMVDNEDYDDVLADGVWQRTFKIRPDVLTAEEKKEFLAGITGVSLGSDAFFPFSDNIQRAYKSGVRYIAETGGSVRDDLVIAEADRLGITMAFTGCRLFHH